MKLKKNLNKTKSYWLYLHPYVHLNIKKSRAIVYNTINGKLHEYSYPGNKEVMRLLKRLDHKKNLYVIRLKEGDITPTVKQFINSIRETYSGDFMDTSYSDDKPIQLKPILNLNISIEQLQPHSRIKILKKDGLLEYLRVINLYINNNCNRGCTLCRNVYKQFLYCAAVEKQRSELDITDIDYLKDNAIECSEMNILGGNILHYLQLAELTERLNNTRFQKGYYLNYLNVKEKKEWFSLLSMDKSNTLHILIHFPFKKKLFSEVMKYLQSIDVNLMFHFVVEKEEDVEVIEGFIAGYNLKDVEFHPYFNGENLSFFKNNIFITRESLVETKPSMRNIFANTNINFLNFRQLTVMSDKSVFANLNHSPIGRLDEDSILDILKKELKMGKSWGRIRKNVIPCKSCAYNALCPPVTNYEYVIGKYNLCNIEK